MLDHALREQLLRLFEGLEASYVFDVTADPGHASRGELLELLEETAACSAKIGCRITRRAGTGVPASAQRGGHRHPLPAVPNGHEFSSLILAVLNADGKGKNLPDEATRPTDRGARRADRADDLHVAHLHQLPRCGTGAQPAGALQSPDHPYGRGRSLVPRGGCTAEYPGRARRSSTAKS